MIRKASAMSLRRAKGNFVNSRSHSNEVGLKGKTIELGYMFDQLKRSQLQPCRKLMDANCDKLLELDNKFQSKQFKRTRVVLNSDLLDSFGKRKRVYVGFAILGIFLKSGSEPDAVTLATLIKGLLSDERKKVKVADVVEFVRYILDYGIYDQVVMLAVIDGLCRDGRHRPQARDIIDRLERKFGEPKAVAYNAFHYGLTKGGMADEALALDLEMVEKDIPDDSDLYEEPSYGSCVFNQSVHDGCCRGLIYSLTEVKEMTCCGIHFYVDTLAVLADEFCRRVKTESDCFKVVDEAIEKARWYKCLHRFLDLKTFKALLDGLIRFGKIDEARYLLKVIEVKGLNPDVYTYGRVIDELCRHGKYDLAGDLMSGIPPEPKVEIYTMILRSFVRREEDGLPKCFLAEMERRGFAPDAVAYNAAVRSLLKRKEVYEAMPLLEEMHRRRFFLDATTYSLLVHLGYGQNEDCFVAEFMEEFLIKDSILRPVPIEIPIPALLEFKAVPDKPRRQLDAREEEYLLTQGVIDIYPEDASFYVHID